MKKNLLLFLSLTCFTMGRAQSPVNALDFDGTNDAVNALVPVCLSNPAASNFTIEVWVYPRVNTFSRIVFAQQSASDFVALSTGGTGNIYCYVVEGGTTYSIATNNAMPLNQWTHVAAVFETTTNTISVYYNGVLQAGTNGGTSTSGTSGVMSLGTRPGGFQYFSGSLDELRIWNVARTQCQISANYTSKLSGTEPNLEVYYDFDEGTAGANNAGVTILSDRSGTNDGSLVGFTLSGTTSNWISSGATITSTGLNGGSSTNVSVAVCSGSNYTYPDGTTMNNITSPVNHTSNLVSVINGCDSIINTSVAVNPVYDFIEMVTVCSGDDYTYPDGTVATNIISPTFHLSNLTSLGGCDSTYSTTINVATVDTTITVNGPTLTSNAVGATYVWINCGTSLPVGVTTADFTPVSGGSFAVQVTQGSCTEQSYCYSVPVGLLENSGNTAFTIFPNPAGNQISIDMNAFGNEIRFSIFDVTGKLITSNEFTNPGIYSTPIDLSKGVYLIQIQSENHTGIQRLIVD